MKSSSNERKNWILGSILTLILAPIGLLISFALGLFYSGSGDITLDSFSSIVTALATLCIAVLTIILAKETWALRTIQIKQIEQLQRNSIKPSLDLYLESGIASGSLLDIHLENNGNGTAHNITFDFTGKDGASLGEIDQKIVNTLQKFQLLKTGMSSLSQKQRRSSYVLSLIELFNELKEKLYDVTIEVHINFSDYEGYKYMSTSTLDFSSYNGMHQVGGGNPTYNIYMELEKIRKLLEKKS